VVIARRYFTSPNMTNVGSEISFNFLDESPSTSPEDSDVDLEAITFYRGLPSTIGLRPYGRTWAQKSTNTWTLLKLTESSKRKRTDPLRDLNMNRSSYETFQTRRGRRPMISGQRRLARRSSSWDAYGSGWGVQARRWRRGSTGDVFYRG
jgi:hypothetical protein